MKAIQLNPGRNEFRIDGKIRITISEDGAWLVPLDYGMTCDAVIPGQVYDDGKKLIDKSWNEVQQEMSLAGEPDKARKFGEAVYALSAQSMDVDNIPSIDNQVFALERVIAELKNWEKIQRDRQHPSSH